MFSSNASRSIASSAVPRTIAGMVQPGELCRPPPPLTHDQLVAVDVRVLGRQLSDRRLGRQLPDRRLGRQLPDRRLGRQCTNHNGLQEPEFPDRVRELGQSLVVEHLPRLPRVGHDGPDRHFLVDRANNVTSWGPGECPDEQVGEERDCASLTTASLTTASFTTASIGAVGINAAKPRPSPPLRCVPDSESALLGDISQTPHWHR